MFLFLFLAAIDGVTSSSCSCDIGKMTSNEGTTEKQLKFAPVTYTQSADGCNLTVHCTGCSNLAFGLYYSRTAQGDSPILDPYNWASLEFQSTAEIELSSMDFKYMRCVDDDWMVYMSDSDYLGQNDPSGDPNDWVMYNNILCVQPDVTCSTTRISTKTTVTSAAPAPTSSGVAISGTYCNCGISDGLFNNWDPSEIWVDLIIILDTSSSLGDSLEEAKSALTSFIALMSTDTTAEFYSRIGVLAASDTIEVIYNLNMSSTANLDWVEPHIVDRIDVGAAFQAALKMFADGEEMKSYREDAKQIIYFLTNSAPGANMNGVNDFKTSGGIIIVNDFILEGDVANPGLKKLASDNFFFTDLSENYLQNLVVLCEANCFCEPSKHAFNDDEISPRTGANRGCFHPVNNGIPQPLARETCQKEGGALVSIHDQEKEFFVSSVVSIFGPKKKYWIGLENDGTSWTWDDKSTDPFADWDVDQPDTNDGKLLCAYATQTTGLNVRWTAANCAIGGAIYVCESAPCSAGNKNC